MIYNYHSDDFLKSYLKLNNVKEEDLDTSSFVIDKEDENLVLFKFKLLSIKNKKTLIVGDYDCDGICSTTIIKKLCEYLEINSNFYIPSREKEGYGINEKIVQMAKENNFEVIITVDNGVVAKEALALAKEQDIKVIVIDHHEYEVEPDCFAFIHPNLLSKDYNNISAGGLSYLISSLFYEDDLSLVLGGLATYGDMVGVLGFNRYLLKKSLSLLKTGKFYQINLLNGGNDYDYDSYSFNIVPKINAISRMNYNPNILVKYLMSDENTCKKTIDSINEINTKRKDLTNKLVKDIDSSIDESTSIALVVNEKITEGLCGLIANRLIDTLNKPVMVFTKKDGMLKGSCRSIEGFNLFKYLLQISDIFETFGGHELALGLSLKEENYDKLIEYINNTKIEYKPVIKDVYVIKEDELNYQLLTKIEALKPFGNDLKEPLIVYERSRELKMNLMANKYPKYFINNEVSAICFNTKLNNDNFDKIIGYLRKDNYSGNKANLLVEDLV